VILKLFANVLWGRRLVLAGVDQFALGVERPEGVAEEVVGIVEVLDLYKAIPVGTVAGLGALRVFVTAEELEATNKSGCMVRREVPV